jgi:hypothetical protein
VQRANVVAAIEPLTPSILDFLAEPVHRLRVSCAGIAVGTAVTGCPPHRSVREELRHTALPSGQTITNEVRYLSLLLCHEGNALSGSASGTSMTMSNGSLR